MQAHHRLVKLKFSQIFYFLFYIARRFFKMAQKLVLRCVLLTAPSLVLLGQNMSRIQNKEASTPILFVGRTINEDKDQIGLRFGSVRVVSTIIPIVRTIVAPPLVIGIITAIGIIAVVIPKLEVPFFAHFHHRHGRDCPAEHDPQAKWAHQKRTQFHRVGRVRA